ncbi:MAG: alpha/beta hydrolase [Actinobacteria bacterium]|nr:alpha/beta hydrolase [Actinomycetota bacterium]
MSFLQTPDGARLRYTERGDGPQTVVLVHGWKGSHRMWDPAMHRLADEFRVISFDNRGMGESDRPTGRYDFDLLADDLDFVLTELGVEDATLVGWSMGCSISLQYLSRGGARAARLVLINGPIRLENDDEWAWGLPAGQLDIFVEELVAAWPGSELEFARGANLDPDGAYADLYYRVALQTELIDSIRIVREQQRLDHRPVLRGLQLPVLAIYGRQDPYYDEGLARYIAEQVPDGRYLMFEQSAHPVHYDEPDRFREVIAEFAQGRL